MSLLELAIAGFIPVFVLVTLTWFLGKKVNNFSIIDATWSFSFLVQALMFSFLASGSPERKTLASAMLGLWSLRLVYFLTRRIFHHHPKIDSRYVKLQEDYGNNFLFRFYLFFLMQAVSVSILTLPFLYVFQNQTALNNWEWAGLILWALALAGESLSDYQMNHFKKNPANAGKTCNVGLWKYSRHPNYFFESLIWWGYYLLFIGSGIWWGIYAPLIILHLLLNVTGVPPSEEQALKNRGDDYRRYQAVTSRFIPWFPKNI